jgi:hypothetical protein
MMILERGRLDDGARGAKPSSTAVVCTDSNCNGSIAGWMQVDRILEIVRVPCPDPALVKLLPGPVGCTAKTIPTIYPINASCDKVLIFCKITNIRNMKTKLAAGLYVYSPIKVHAVPDPAHTRYSVSHILISALSPYKVPNNNAALPRVTGNWPDSKVRMFGVCGKGNPYQSLDGSQ